MNVFEKNIYKRNRIVMMISVRIIRHSISYYVSINISQTCDHRLSTVLHSIAGNVYHNVLNLIQGQPITSCAGMH